MIEMRMGATSVVFLVLLSFSCIIIIAVANANANDDGEQSKKSSAMWVWQRLRSAAAYSSIFPTTIGQYWHMAKAIVNHTYAYFFPPNIDFRTAAADDNLNGAGEKVKQALTKSIGTSKATLEDVAKSAADKVKRTLSDNENKRRLKEL